MNNFKNIFNHIKSIIFSTYSLLMLLMSFFVAVVIAKSLLHHSEKDILRSLDEESMTIRAAIGQKTDNYLIGLLSFSSFIQTTDRLNKKDFDNYIESLNKHKLYPNFNNFVLSINPNILFFNKEDENIETLQYNIDQHQDIFLKIPDLIDYQSTFMNFKEEFKKEKEGSMILFVNSNTNLNDKDLVGKNKNTLEKLDFEKNNIWIHLPVYMNVLYDNKDKKNHLSYLGVLSASFKPYTYNTLSLQKNYNVHIYSSAEFKEKNIIEEFNERIYRKIFSMNIYDNKYYIVYETNPETKWNSEKREYTIIGILIFIKLYLLSLIIYVLSGYKKTAIEIAESMTMSLRNMAWFDQLTGLLNRARILEIIEDKIKEEKLFILLFIDLDGFKKVNDTLGHEAGDEILRKYTENLQTIFYKNKEVTLGRVGGDEFVLIYEYINDHTVETNMDLIVEVFCEQVRKATVLPFEIKNHKFILSQSIGVALSPKDSKNSDELIRKADMAMYHNKKFSPHHFSFYTHEMEKLLLEKTEIEGELTNSIKNNELFLVLQPKMKKDETGKFYLSGAETLIRWNSQKFGLVRPDKFISIAEENGFIFDITNWILDNIAAQMIIWRELFHFEPKISINLSAQQFLSEKLCNQIIDRIKENEINPKQIIFEITEGTVMKDPAFAIKMLHKFTNNGFSFSIDDFGTGYSSLAYLTNLPVSELKIDKSFVFKALKEKNSAAVITAIIAMSHNLGLKVVAEGVETKEQLDFLDKNNCDEYQGYYFSKPLNVNDFIDFAENYNQLQRIYTNLDIDLDKLENNI